MSQLIRRLEFFIVTFWAAVSLNFLLPRFMPGDPVGTMMAKQSGSQIDPRSRHAMEKMLGLDTETSTWQQYIEYWGHVFNLDFGLSITYFPTPVSQVIGDAMPWTLGLVTITLLLAFSLGTLLGALAAWRRGGRLDSILPPLFIVIGGLPFFWVGLLFIYLFSIELGWFDVGFGYNIQEEFVLNWNTVGQILSHAVLPAVAIILTSIGGWILTMRNTMIGVLNEDYLKMARAKGLSNSRIMMQYAGRNAILPNLTGFAMSLGFVVSGALLVELVFTYPGIGFQFVKAVQGQDYPLMQALFLLVTTATLVAVLLADAITYFLDPRTRGKG
jgi:peptide/nickel transport system permease protein